MCNVSDYEKKKKSYISDIVHIVEERKKNNVVEIYLSSLASSPQKVASGRN